MKIEPFDFSRNVNKIELYQHLCYYHNEADNCMCIIDENKQVAFSNFKELYHLLKEEYHEYSKVKNYKYIHSNCMYSKYANNITKAYVKPTNVRSYKMLNSNLYDIKDYITTGFGEIFYLKEGNIFDKSKIDYFLGKICCIKLKNYNVYVGQVDIKLFDSVEDKIESISVLFLGQWKQIYIRDIDKIKIIEE